MPFFDANPKTMQHTPGPWVISPEEIIRDCNGKAIAILIKREGMKANGNLISAAPDMLEALNIACAQFKSYQIHHAVKKEFVEAYEHQKFADYLQIVINKAIGQPQE